MGRLPVFSSETTTRIVLAVLAGEVSARRETMSEQSIRACLLLGVVRSGLRRV